MGASAEIRMVTPDDFEAVSDIYASLWCRRMLARGEAGDAALCARFNTALQLQRSAIPMVAEVGGRVVAACMVGLVENGTSTRNPDWIPAYEALLAEATERAKTADEDLEGSLFGDSREMAYGERYIAAGGEYAEAQVNLIIIHPEYQRQGIGTMLLDAARGRMAEAGVRRFFLTTDSSSDVSFYDHIGMLRIDESAEQDTGDGFRTYIYGGVTA